jgi:hypothetical protein
MRWPASSDLDPSPAQAANTVKAPVASNPAEILERNMT